jgi:hypothetical protein
VSLLDAVGFIDSIAVRFPVAALLFQLSLLYLL